MSTYSTARQSGLIAPLAAIVAAYRSVPTLAKSIRTIDPAGAGLIFATAWIAGYVGSAGALLVAAALFAGLYLAKLSAQPVAEVAAPIVAATTAAPAQPVDAIAGQLGAGLIVSQVTLKQPTAAKSPRVSTT